ncbi:MAG TPA: oxidoreductase, partial [Chroococcales cyanobacterium]
RRAREACFDLLELHAAHGYLINEFLSPLANKREDEYGGPLVNRFRLLGEVIAEVRLHWSGPLFVRLSAEEYAEGGHHIEESIEIARMLKKLAIDLIDVSSGGVVEVPIEDYPGYQVGFSEQIKQRAEIPTGAVGLITDARQAEGILLQKQADLIFLGRELLRHPYWPLDAVRCLEADIPWPVQYERART